MPTSTTGSSSENGPRGPIPSIFPQVGNMHSGKGARSYIRYNRNKMRCDEMRNGLGYAQSNHPVGKRKVIEVAKRI